MDNDERLCAIENRLRLKLFPPQAVFEAGTATVIGPALKPTELSGLLLSMEWKQT